MNEATAPTGTTAPASSPTNPLDEFGQMDAVSDPFASEEFPSDEAAMPVATEETDLDLELEDVDLSQAVVYRYEQVKNGEYEFKIVEAVVGLSGNNNKQLVLTLVIDEGGAEDGVTVQDRIPNTKNSFSAGRFLNLGQGAEVMAPNGQVWVNTKPVVLVGRHVRAKLKYDEEWERMKVELYGYKPPTGHSNAPPTIPT